MRSKVLYSVFNSGKLPPDLLKSNVLGFLGNACDSVVVGPSVGEDSAVLRLDPSGSLFCAKTDPITGASSDIGRFCVHINANDIAASGAVPKWMLVTQLLPVGTSASVVQDISRQIHETCCSLGVSIVGGHTELTPAVNVPVLCGTMLGPLLSAKPIKTGGARVGDHIVVTKGIALEAMSIMCYDKTDALVKRGVFHSVDQCHASGAEYSKKISVVQDARIALTGLPEGSVSSMHDPTEGGLAGAIHEVADACGKGFELIGENIPTNEDVKRLAKAFEVNPLELISSGALLLCVSPEQVENLLALYKENNIIAKDIGRVVENRDTRSISWNNQKKALPRPDQDALWDLLKN